MSQNIWEQIQGEYGPRERAPFDEVINEYPELAQHLEKQNGFKYNDGATFKYYVSAKDGYPATVYRDRVRPRSGGGRSFSRQQAYRTLQQPAQDFDRDRIVGIENKVLEHEARIAAIEEVLRRINEGKNAFFDKAADVQTDINGETEQT